MLTRIACVLIVYLSSCTHFFAQPKGDYEKISNLLSKSIKVYDSNARFKLTTSYEFFPSYASNLAVKKYDGLVIKNKQQFYSKIGMTEFLALEDKSVKVDNESKLIQVGERNMESEINTIYNLKSMLAHFNEFNLTVKGDYYVCSMTSPQITFIPYAKIIISIHKTDFTIAKQVYYLLQKAEYTDKNGKKKQDFPRLEIRLSKPELKNIDLSTKFELGHYVSFKSAKAKPSRYYANYKIVD